MSGINQGTPTPLGDVTGDTPNNGTATIQVAQPFEWYGKWVSPMHVTSFTGQIIQHIHSDII